MGKSKPKVQASTAESAFKDIGTYNVDLGGFGKAESFRNDGQITTRFNATPFQNQAREQAELGATNSLNRVNETPQDYLARIQAGSNPFYNTQAALNRENALNAYNDLQARMSQSGLENSTVLGAFAGQQARDYNLQDLATRQAAIEQENAMALNSLQSNQNVLNQLYGFAQVPTDMASQNMMQGFQNADQVAMFNANQMQQASQANAQLAQQRSAARSALMGNLLGAGLTAAALPFAGAGLGAIRGIGPATGSMTSPGLANAVFGSQANPFNRASMFAPKIY